MLKRKRRFTFILVSVFCCLFIIAFVLLPSVVGYTAKPCCNYFDANSDAKLTYTNTAAYITICEASGIQVPDMAV